MTTRPRNFPQFGGVKVKPRLLFARATPGNNKRQGTVLTFAADTTWAAPAGARILQRLVGKGADGKPPTGSHNYQDGWAAYRTTVTYVKSQDRYIYGTEQLTSSNNLGPVPGAQREKTGEDDSFIYYVDFRAEYRSVDTGDYVGPTTGAAATGFGQVFAGGPSGQPAPVSTFLNVQIATGTSYSIVVPLGGYITIEY